MKPLDKNETGELIAAIHSLGKDKVRELALLMWQHIYELDAANSPETPDCWVSCSEHMPVDCQTVLCSNLLTELSGIPFIADYVGMFEIYDGTKYESGFYVNRELQTVTHWMPLPAAPKPEK